MKNIKRRSYSARYLSAALNILPKPRPGTPRNFSMVYSLPKVSHFRHVAVLFVLLSIFVADAEDVMSVDSVFIVSKDSVLTKVDTEGKESKFEAGDEKVSVGNAGEDSSDALLTSPSPLAVSSIRPGERIEVIGGTAADMIISEAVTARLEPGTRIELPKLVKDEKPKASLKLLKGKMFITIDAAQLKKSDNLEFRLETPKSLLAVKGTKFVVTSEENSDLIVLLEGEVAVRDEMTTEFVRLRSGEVTTVTGKGKLQVRSVNNEELEYGKVFDQAKLEFVPYKIGRDISIAKTRVTSLSGVDTRLPERDFSVGRWKYNPRYGMNLHEIRLQALSNRVGDNFKMNVSFQPERLRIKPENVIGVLLHLHAMESNYSARNATVEPSKMVRLQPTVRFMLACTKNAVLVAEGKIRIYADDGNAFNTDRVSQILFVPSGLITAGSAEQLETWRSLLAGEIFMDETVPIPSFHIFISSIQVISQGG